jgi:hypothetical protein
MAASTTVSNVLGMTYTEASVQTAAMKVQWCVSPINILPTVCQPFTVLILFLLASIILTIQMHRSSRMHTCISSECNPLSHSPTAPPGIPPLQHTRGPKTTRRFNRVRACTVPAGHPTLLM